MRVVFRVDASTAMGVGHLRRCLALADALRRHAVEVSVITREFDIDSTSLVETAGIAARRLPALDHDLGFTRPVGAPVHATWAGVAQLDDASQTCRIVEGDRVDWIVVDHYAFDAEWHRCVRHSTGARVCAIDDLADRDLDADILIDHNLAADHKHKYGAHASAACRILGGPRFALLDRVYENAPPYAFDRVVRSIGIFMGGTDPWRASALALRACRGVAGFTGPIEIATTRSNPHMRELAALCEQLPPTELLIDAPNLAGFFARHDLQVGAGGGASWERCCMGAPTVAVAMASNQSASLVGLAVRGAIRTAETPDVRHIGREVAALLNDPPARMALAVRSRGLVDGLGARRAALALLADEVTLHPATLDDAMLAHRWRNASETRRYFRDPTEVALSAHLDWWRQSLGDQQRRLLMAWCIGIRVGCVRLDLNNHSAEVSFYLDPGLTGIGLGSTMLRAVQAWVLHREATLERLLGEVHPDNTRSARAFNAAGFRQTGPRNWLWEVHQ